jgi:hypothetical protein
MFHGSLSRGVSLGEVGRRRLEGQQTELALGEGDRPLERTQRLRDLRFASSERPRLDQILPEQAREAPDRSCRPVLLFGREPEAEDFRRSTRDGAVLRGEDLRRAVVEVPAIDEDATEPPGTVPR